MPVLLSQIKKQEAFGDYEIIVADAGSKDKTAEIARSFGAKVVKGGLPARGRNQGAKAARGDVLLFTDADNFYLPPGFLKKILVDFRDKELGIACFSIYPDGKKIDKIFYKIYNETVYLTNLPSAFNSVLVRKDVFEKVGGFDEKVRVAEDHYFTWQAAKHGKFGFIKTDPVLTSSRRFEKEGRPKLYFKIIFAAIYYLFVGPIKTDIFKYRFNIYNKD